MYVALTRATEELILIKNTSEDALPFLKDNIREISSKYPDKISIISNNSPSPKSISVEKEKEKDFYHETSVTELISYLKTTVIENVSLF